MNTFIKIFLAALIGLASIVTTATAHDRYRGGWSNHSHYGEYRYKKRVDRYDRRRHRRHGRHDRRESSNAGAIIGIAVLGAIIGAGIVSSQERTRRDRHVPCFETRKEWNVTWQEWDYFKERVPC